MNPVSRPVQVLGARTSPIRAPLRALERVVRVLGVGMLFAIFGIGGLLLATLVIPPLGWLRGPGNDRELMAQRVIHHSFRFFTWFGSSLHLLGLEERGTERLLHPGQLVIANHPSLLDVVYLISRMPQADCVVKRALWRNPMLRSVVKVCGYIPNDGGEAVVDACSERLLRGRSVILFPEGSRSPYGNLGPFQRGAAYVALASKCPITPVVIQVRPPALKKGQPWYALPNERLMFSLEVGESFFARDQLQEELPRTIAARRLTVGFRSLFDSRLADGIA
jgi:1-acyl-sn-glycerol-3-phosphate acyltransferase